MKAVIASVLSFGLWSVEAQNCCPGIKVIEATLNDGGNTQRLRRVLQQQEDSCLAARSAAIKKFPKTDLWTKTGEGLIETVFSRFGYDMGKEASYWLLEDDSAVPVEERVAVINVSTEVGFGSGWPTAPGQAAIADACATGFDWMAADLGAGLKDKALWYIIRAPAAVHESWHKWFRVEWSLTKMVVCTVNSVDTCRVAVVEQTEDFYADVLAGLKAAEATNNPFDSCDVCASTTTTTLAPIPVVTTDHAIQPTPATTIKEDPVSTNPTNETTTAGEGEATDGTVRMAAVGGVVPAVIVSAVIAMMM